MDLPPAIVKARAEAKARAEKLIGKAEGTRKEGLFKRSSNIKAKPIDLSYEVEDNRGAPSWSIKQGEGKGKAKVYRQEVNVPDLYVQEPLRIPKTEKELLDALVVLRTLEPRVTAEKLFTIHSHFNLRHIISRRTYTYLLTHAYKDSNLRLAREILVEMEERGIKRNEMIERVLLRSNLVRGDAQGVDMVLQGIQERKVVALPILNWRRDLGEDWKGQGDDFKVWNKKVVKDDDNGKEGKEEDPTAVSTEPSSKSGWKPKQIVSSPISLPSIDTKLTRKPSSIPDRFEKLSAYDIKALVEALVQDQRAPESFLISQSWLDVNRPSLQPPPPPLSAFMSRTKLNTPAPHKKLSVLTPTPSIRRQIRYRPSPLFILPRLEPIPTAEEVAYRRAQVIHNRTTLTLLNILVKSLLSTGSTPTSCKTFVHAFLERNSFPGSKVKLLPDQVTLLELLQGLNGSSNSWMKSMRMINWFGVNFGFRVRLAHGKYGRRLFKSSHSKHRISPQYAISFEIGRLLLRYAIADSKSANLSNLLKEKVRKWWKAVDKREAGWSVTETFHLVQKASEAGLIGGEGEVTVGRTSRNNSKRN